MSNYNDQLVMQLNALSSKIDDLLSKIDRNEDDPHIYTCATAAKKLGVCSRILQKYRDEGRIEYTQIGRKIFYTDENIKKFLEAYKVRGRMKT